MSRTSFIIAVLFLLTGAGCSHGPTYSETLQVYELEQAQLDRLKDERAALDAEVDAQFAELEILVTKELGAVELATLRKKADEVGSEEAIEKEREEAVSEINAKLKLRGEVLTNEFKPRFLDLDGRTDAQAAKVQLAKEAMEAAAIREGKSPKK